MIKYPNGETYKPLKKDSPRKKIVSLDNCSNRGMALEEDISSSSDFYNAQGRCLIYKRPTPIKVVRMDKINKTKIIEGYFSSKSTTDYNGTYRGKYLDFEAKETINHTSFSFHNIRPQQITHLKSVIDLGGIAFFIIRMKAYDETYLVKCEDLLPKIYAKEKCSIPYEFIKERGFLIEVGFTPALKYLDAIDKAYFNGEENKELL